MSFYNRQPKPERSRRERALIIDGAKPPIKEPTNPDVKPSDQARKSLKVFGFVVLGMVIFAFISVKLLEHLWQKRDRAIMRSARSLREEPSPSVLSTTAPVIAVEIPTAPTFDRPLPSNTEQAETIFRWGKVLEEAGELNGALTRYQEALAIDPSHPQILAETGRLLIRLNRHAEAVTLLERAESASPGHPDILNDLGVALTFAGRAEAAVTLYEQVRAAHPDYAPALFNQGYALVQLRNHEQARPLLEAYVEKRPDDAMALGVLAIMELAEQHHEKALGLLDRAIAAAPNWVTPYLDAASIHASLGQDSQALNYLERALDAGGPAEVYQHYMTPVFRSLRTSDAGKGLEKKIADRARQLLK
ncbi:MAG TPA: tetratricopeptide repeat protein [Kiritimatiellia bacterium]|nr:tetratricopeptide repeat protein [Kiritimatiellia bacterium]HMO99497.1 tetratricopeptide repeat protein [Kiritimatiellia bacterium]